MVDHLHFQYNGFLLGILLLSISYLEEGRDLIGGFTFAVLLCFKHLFAVAAPVYFVYLFRHYCRGGLLKGFGRLVLMGSVVLAVFAAAFGPFLYYGQVDVLSQFMLAVHAECYSLSHDLCRICLFSSFFFCCLIDSLDLILVIECWVNFPVALLSLLRDDASSFLNTVRNLCYLVELRSCFSIIASFENCSIRG